MLSYMNIPIPIVLVVVRCFVFQHSKYASIVYSCTKFVHLDPHCVRFMDVHLPIVFFVVVHVWKKHCLPTKFNMSALKSLNSTSLQSFVHESIKLHGHACPILMYMAEVVFGGFTKRRWFIFCTSPFSITLPSFICCVLWWLSSTRRRWRKRREEEFEKWILHHFFWL